MKKIIIVVMIVVFVASLSVFSISCKKSTENAEIITDVAAESTTEATETSKGSSTEIKFLAYNWMALDDETLQKFTELTGINVVQESLGYEEVNTKIKTSSAAGISPGDIVCAYSAPLASEVAANFIEPLDKYIPQDFITNHLAANSFIFNGKLMGIGENFDMNSLFYRKDLTSQAGITSAPTTYDELFRDMLIVKEKGINNYPLQFPLAAHPGTAHRWMQITMAFQGGSLFDENYKPIFADGGENSSGYKALKFIMDALDQGLIDPAFIEIDNAETGKEYIGGIGVYNFDTISMINGAELDTSKIKGKNAYTLSPGTDKIKSSSLDFTDGVAISILSKNKDAAWKFIEWFDSYEPAKARFLTGGMTPTNIDVYKKLAEEGLIKGGDFVVEQSKYLMPLYSAGIPPWREEWDTFVGGEINQSARGNQTIMETIQNIANKAVELQK